MTVLPNGGQAPLPTTCHGCHDGDQAGQSRAMIALRAADAGREDMAAHGFASAGSVSGAVRPRCRRAPQHRGTPLRSPRAPATDDEVAARRESFAERFRDGELRHCRGCGPMTPIGTRKGCPLSRSASRPRRQETRVRPGRAPRRAPRRNIIHRRSRGIDRSPRVPYSARTAIEVQRVDHRRQPSDASRWRSCSDADDSLATRTTSRSR